MLLSGCLNFYLTDVCIQSCFITTVDNEAELPPPDEHRVITMKLKVRCKRNPKPPEGATTPVDLYTNAHGMDCLDYELLKCDHGILVKTSHLEWVPIGEQAKKVYFFIML